MYLGIDVGTSGVKALLIDDGGSVVANDTAPLDVLRPHAGWSEQTRRLVAGGKSGGAKSARQAPQTNG